MFRPDERDSEGDVNRPRRRSHPPSYLQDYEVRHPMRHRSPVDEHTRQTTTTDVLHCLRSMREENEQLRLDVLRLTNMMSSSPVLASPPAKSWPRRNVEKTPSTPAHASQLTPFSGHQDPRQHDNATQVTISDESPHSPCSQRDPIVELSDSLQRAGLSSQHVAQSPVTSGESSPHYTDFPPDTPKGSESPPPQGSGAVAKSQLYHQERSCPPSGAVHHQPVDSYSPHHGVTFNQPDGRHRSQRDDAYRRHDDSFHPRDDKYHAQYGAACSQPDDSHSPLYSASYHQPDVRARPLPDERYHHSRSQATASYRQPGQRAHHDDGYHWQDDRHRPSDPIGRHDDHYRPVQGYGYYHGHDEQYRHLDDRYSDDHRHHPYDRLPRTDR
ncbi:uncharacterized protein LOC121815826, partial [Scomber scombrus]